LARELSAKLRTVPDMEDFDYFVGIPVDNNVRFADKLASSFQLSGPAHAGEGCQFFNAGDNSLGDIPCSKRVVFPDVFDSSDGLVRCISGPTDLPHHEWTCRITSERADQCG
jgi:hypothetical protein